MSLPTPTPEHDCPRWPYCSVNDCPLSAQHFEPHPLDKKRKCSIEKPVRQRIAAKYYGILPHGGLNNSEWAAKQRFESLSFAQKLAMAEQGNAALAKLDIHRRLKNLKTSREP